MYIPPKGEKVSEDFNGYKLISLLNLFLNYNYIELKLISYDITTFLTLISLFRIYRILIGSTNLVI